MELDELPTMDETVKAINQLKNGKLVGVDVLYLELWKFGRSVLHRKLHKLFWTCWDKGKIPNDLRESVVITIYKTMVQKLII